jgi:hypothetical protein
VIIDLHSSPARIQRDLNVIQLAFFLSWQVLRVNSEVSLRQWLTDCRCSLLFIIPFCKMEHPLDSYQFVTVLRAFNVLI